MPLDKMSAADEAKKRLAGSEPSDHWALLMAYEGWRQAKASGGEWRFCRANYLSATTLAMAHDFRKQFLDLLKDAQLVSEAADVNQRAGCWGVVKAALCAGLYPNLIRVDFKKNRCSYFTKENGNVKLHPASVNSKERHWDRRWLMYHEKIKTPGGVVVYDTTELAPLAVLLNGQRTPRSHASETKPLLRISPEQVRAPRAGYCIAGVEDWVYYEIPEAGAALIESLRFQLDFCVDKLMFADAHRTEEIEQFIKCVCEALSHADDEGDGSYMQSVSTVGDEAEDDEDEDLATEPNSDIQASQDRSRRQISEYETARDEWHSESSRRGRGRGHGHSHRGRRR
jgi:hypothetical protein